MNSTLARVYSAIVAIPLGVILFAGAIGGGHSQSDDNDGSHYPGDSAPIVPHAIADGAGKTEAEAYSVLGKYNPCIFIACDGE
jgi:hypothetical protein